MSQLQIRDGLIHNTLGSVRDHEVMVSARNTVGG